jgi:hypothetical protein
MHPGEGISIPMLFPTSVLYGEMVLLQMFQPTGSLPFRIFEV